MSSPTCVCGHEKRDHRQPRNGNSSYGECKVCLCEAFDKVKPPLAPPTAIADHSSLKSGASVIDWILERIERKCCPQGLNVILEELQWMGQENITHDKLSHAVSLELRKPHPRIETVAEGIYWFANKSVPAGWSMFNDRRMLPCFYREYPPEIAWEDLDRPENILPPPLKLSRD